MNEYNDYICIIDSSIFYCHLNKVIIHWHFENKSDLAFKCLGIALLTHLDLSTTTLRSIIYMIKRVYYFIPPLLQGRK